MLDKRSKDKSSGRKKGCIWIVYIFSSAVVAFNMYLMTRWNHEQTSNAIQTTINIKNEQNDITTQGQGKEEEQDNRQPSSASGHHDPFTVAICVVMKDAENYFEEWLDYHFALGFDAIYIYDNSPTFELKNWYDNTRNHATFGKVEVVHWTKDTEYTQDISYQDCVEKFGRSKTRLSGSIRGSFDRQLVVGWIIR